MKRNNLVIEIGCEDLPSWAGSCLEERWLPFLENSLRENRIEYASLRFFHTLRRVILYFSGIAEVQKDAVAEIYGPPAESGIDKKGNYTQAAQGFAASYHVDVHELVLREKKGRKVLAVIKKDKGRPVKKIIGKIIIESLRRTEIPRAMKWQGADFKFIRPVRWILALIGDEIVEVELPGIKGGRYSFGHRVLSPGRFKVASADEYFDAALKKFVMFDSDLRSEFVKAVLKKNIACDVRFDENHLREIADTVEYPCAAKCLLNKEYMELPPEVVSAVIRNLKGLPLSDAAGRLEPFYALVFDGVQGKDIEDNYQAVLAAKMDDAVFFMKQDAAVPFASYTENLKKISYHPEWGSVFDRVLRFRKVADVLFRHMDFPEEVKLNVYTIISLCKNDLATLMVAEFPSLEGVIGRIYAEKNGFNGIIAKGIEQHYLPKTPNGNLPDSTEASIVSAIERIESLCGMFLDNVEIKGTGDPYGIKKIANGLIEIIWHENFVFPLRKVVNESLEIFGFPAEAACEKIVCFLLQRVENLLAGEGLARGLRSAVISTENENLLNIRLKTDALKQFFAGGQGQNILVPFIRVANILRQAEEKGIGINLSVDENLFREDTEKIIYDFFKNTEGLLKKMHKEKDYLAFLKNLGSWREIIDRFFDDVLVMCEEEEIRGNRLALLKQINGIFGLFADFSLIPPAEVENG